MDMTKNVQTRMGVKVVPLDSLERQQKKKFAFMMRKQEEEYLAKCIAERQKLFTLIQIRQKEALTTDSRYEADCAIRHVNEYLLPKLHSLDNEIAILRKNNK